LGEHHKVGPQLLVHLPDNLSDGFVFPDFGKITTGVFWMAVMSIALVTAIESVLSAIAVDSLDSKQRKTDLDKDLKGLGAGSALSSMIGGLPMISEIVRSSANASSGAKTQWSNFFHGVFLLLFIVVGGPIINHIPLAALAAMLIFTGYRLASPKEFKHVYHIGILDFIVFVSTMIVVLLTDLLIGVGIGIVLNLLFNIFKGVSLGNVFRVQLHEEKKSNEVVLHLSGALIFSNYLGLKKHVMAHATTPVTIDLASVNYIDHSVMHQLHMLEIEFSVKKVAFEIINDNHLISDTDHPLSAKKESGVGHEVKKRVLNSRQKALSKLASTTGMMFSPEKTMERNGRMRAFQFAAKGRVNYTYNLITGNFGQIPFEYCEMQYDADLETQSATAELGMMMFRPAIKPPAFTLEQEGFMDKLAELGGYNDIDFDAYPDFSSKFLLKGENEAAVRQFFGDEMIHLLEKDSQYHIESDGEIIIIYRFDRKIDINKIKQLFDFAEKLAPLVAYQGIGV
jgi:hypothetical protein